MFSGHETNGSVFQKLVSQSLQSGSHADVSPVSKQLAIYLVRKGVLTDEFSHTVPGGEFLAASSFSSSFLTTLLL